MQLRVAAHAAPNYAVRSEVRRGRWGLPWLGPSLWVVMPLPPGFGSTSGGWFEAESDGKNVHGGTTPGSGMRASVWAEGRVALMASGGPDSGHRSGVSRLFGSQSCNLLSCALVLLSGNGHLTDEDGKPVIICRVDPWLTGSISRL